MRAYAEAGLGPDDLDCAEVYDLSTAMELDWYEQIGLCAPGEAEKLLRDGATTLGGRVPVNASGGLACFGEAVPAQAIAQVCELTWQVQGRAEGRQVEGAHGRALDQPGPVRPRLRGDRQQRGRIMKLSPRYDAPSLLSIDGRADDQGVVVARQRRRMEALLAGLGESDWQTPSRCDGWTIQDVIAHLVTVNNFWEASVKGGLAGTPTRILASFDPAAHPPLLIEPMRALSGREVLDQFVVSNDGFLDTLAPLDDESWSKTAESPAGHVSIRLLAAHTLWDSWIHEHDIALPLGLDPAEEPDEIASCLRYAAAVGPALTISQNKALVSVFAVAATDPDVSFTLEVDDAVLVHDEPTPPHAPCLRGPAVDLVEALSIRAALPTDAPAQWHQLVTGLATVFDNDNTDNATR